MSADWAAWAAIGITVAAYVLRDGIRRGKIDAVLERLTELGRDHENRIRGLELDKRPSGPQHRSGPRHRA